MSTVLWILFWTLIWPLGGWLVDRAVNPRTPERRVRRLLAWYPPSWRERHGAALGELLTDAVADGRGGTLLAFDVAREGMTERVRAVRAVRASAVSASALIGVGWLMFFPQGVVAAVLTQVDIPPSWFLALHMEGELRFLVAGAMAGVGILLVDRGMRLGAKLCGSRLAG